MMRTKYCFGPWGGIRRWQIFLGLTEADIARLHIAAQEVLELESIDLQLIKDAVEATQLHWSDQN